MSALEVRSYGAEARPRVGFFTDTSICIGCKACEVACKEWNRLPAAPRGFTGNSYDNTGALGASTWRHVAFVEQRKDGSAGAGGGTAGAGGGTAGASAAGAGASGAGRDAPPEGTVVALHQRKELGPDAIAAGSLVEAAELASLAAATGLQTYQDGEGMRWLMASDVCKHCTHAACLEVCPTGALFRTEMGTVVVQEDICNGCGYCVPACPFGVIDRREDDGRAWKCTLCYDRLKDDRQPACAQACPTGSIQFGELDELRERAQRRLERLTAAGAERAQLYLADDEDGIGGAGAFFLLLDDPEVYGLPPDPVDPTRELRESWLAVGAAAAGLALAVAGAVLGGRRR